MENFDPEAALADRDKILGDMGNMASSYENTIAALRSRIAELEAGLEFVHNAHTSWKDFEETKQWWDAGDEAAQKLAKNLLANKVQS